MTQERRRAISFAWTYVVMRGASRESDRIGRILELRNMHDPAPRYRFYSCFEALNVLGPDFIGIYPCSVIRQGYACIPTVLPLINIVNARDGVRHPFIIINCQPASPIYPIHSLSTPAATQTSPRTLPTHPSSPDTP